MLCPLGMGGKLRDDGEPWSLSADDLWRAAPALARQARRYRLAQFGGSPARRCLSKPLKSSELSQFVKEEHAACQAADRRRYNFDFETLQPLEGPFSWEPVSPPLVRHGAGEELSCCSPEAGLVRPAPELGRREPEGADRVAGRTSGPLRTELQQPDGAKPHTADTGGSATGPQRRERGGWRAWGGN